MRRLIGAAYAVWLLCYVVYPAWYVPSTGSVRFAVFTLYLAYLSANWRIALAWLRRDFERRALSGLRVEGAPRTPTGIRWRASHSLLLLVGLVALAFHIYPMTMPILSRTDSHYHAAIAVPVVKAVNSIMTSHLSIGLKPIAWSVVAAGTVLLILRLARGRRGHLPRTGSNSLPLGLRAALVVGGVVAAYGYFFLLARSGIIDSLSAGKTLGSGLSGELGPEEHLFRYPPLGKAFQFVSLSLFGINEFAVYFIQVVFSLAGAWLLYRMARFCRAGSAPLLSFSIFLFVPAVFCFAHDSVLDSGTLFFAILGNYYFLRHLEKDDFESLVLACLITGIGFLYKHLVAALPFIFWAYLVILRWKGRWGRLRQEVGFYVRWSWVAIAPIVPWLVLGYRYSYRNYDFDAGRFISLSAWLGELNLISVGFTLPGALLVLVALAYGLWKRRDLCTGAMVVWSVVYYFVVTPSAGAGGYVRHSLILYPPLVFLLAQLVSDAATRMRSRAWAFLVQAGVVIYFILAAVWLRFPPASPECGACYRDIRSRYLPYDSAIGYVRDNLPAGSRVLATMASEPSHFYLMKYDIEKKVVWYRKKWAEPAEQTLDNLYEFCQKNAFEYVLFPRGRWLAEFVNEALVEKLAAGADPRFVRVMAFTSGTNEIILWRVLGLRAGQASVSISQAG